MLSAPDRHTAPIAAARLRVLAIAHSAITRTNGRLRYEQLVATRNDLDLTLLVPNRWHEYGRDIALDPWSGPMDIQVQPVRLLTLPRVGWYAHHYPGLRGLLQGIRPDVIQLWEEPWSLVALQAVWLRDRLLPKTALLLETDQNILRPLPPPFEQIRRYTLGRTDLLIGRQPESLEVARACGFSGPTAIVEYGVSDLFRPEDRPGARDALGVTGFVIGYVGRIVPDKGLHDVLDALAACEADVTLVVVGDGPDRQAFEAHAKAVGVWDRVRMVAPKPPREVARLMNAMDVLVLMSRTMPTWKEQFGRVIMEAQACGVPVIGSDSGAIPWVVGDGGWITPERDAAALAQLIRRLSVDTASVEAAGAAGLAQARSRYSLATVAEGLADAMVRAAAHRRASPRR